MKVWTDTTATTASSAQLSTKEIMLVNNTRALLLRHGLLVHTKVYMRAIAYPAPAIEITTNCFITSLPPTHLRPDKWNFILFRRHTTSYDRTTGSKNGQIKGENRVEGIVDL
jgi:hypothetical protein